MSTIQVETPPVQEPVTLATVKKHLRVTLANDDDLIELYMQSARELVEAETGRSLINKIYRQTHDRFPRHHELWDVGSGYSYRAPRYAHHWADMRQAIKLLRCPLNSVPKVTYIDTSGTLQTLLPTPESPQLSTEYELGDQFVDSNGNLQEVTGVAESGEDGSSESGSTFPVWNVTPAGTTTWGDLTVTNQGVAPTGDFLVDRDSEPPRIMPLFAQFWPATQEVPNAVKVYFNSGYGDDAASAPATLKVGLMMAVGVSYENREAVTAEQLRELDWYERMIWSQRVLDWDPTR